VFRGLFLVRNQNQISTEKPEGQFFTLVFDNTSDVGDESSTKKIRICHLCEKSFCPIDCTFGKWFIEDNAPEKSEFSNSAVLVNAYQDGRTEIIKSNERLKLGKPVCMNHVKKLLENQIQLSNLTQRKFILNKKLLEDSESSDEDWEVITNGFERDDQKINGLIAEKNEAISNLTILINEATRIKAMIYETSKAIQIHSSIRRESPGANLICEICHCWYWKVGREEAEALLFHDPNVEPGAFCIRPRNEGKVTMGLFDR